MKYFSLKTCETTSYSQVKFLPSINGFRLILIRHCEILDCNFQIGCSQSGEFGSKQRLKSNNLVQQTNDTVTRMNTCIIQIQSC